MPLVQRTELLMGNRFDLGVVSSDLDRAERAVEEAIVEIKRIEALLTTFKDDSQTNLINRMAGISPVEVDKEVYELIKRAQRISKLTQGAFDLSYGSLDKSLWNFDQKMAQLPSPEKALESVGLINYENIELGEGTVFLREKGMLIGFGGIGKGYAADRAKKVLQELDRKSVV